jgi:glycosyltransferase involved in cell wall biosynthesis
MKNIEILRKECEMLIIGILKFVYYSTKKFNSAQYIANHKCTNKPKNKTNNISYGTTAGADFSKISGFWLNLPKLHYYTFNYPLEQKNKKITKKIREINVKEFNYAKPFLIIITHELSRTGAPILALELAKKLHIKYNIIIYSLKDGPLNKDFRRYSILDVILMDKGDNNHSNLHYIINEIKKENCKINAIVNSICSHQTLDILNKNGVKTNMLIHEFASYIKDIEIFNKCFKYSDKVFFPAQIVLDNVQYCFPNLKLKKALVHPQGFIPAPTKKNNGKCEKHIKDEKIVTIIGIGTIEMRKGVDLFISTAQFILSQNIGKKFRFLWVGANGLHESIYRVYLNDQIERANLQDIVHIKDSVEDLTSIYEQADIFFLSSRLDPLPLVSIEAMNYGIPLVCFKDSTGISEYLLKNKSASYGVAKYLDIYDAGSIIKSLIEDKYLRYTIGSSQKELVSREFNMDIYIDVITKDFKS